MRALSRISLRFLQVAALLIALGLSASAGAQQWSQALPDLEALRAEPAPAPPVTWIAVEGVNLYGYAHPDDRRTLGRLVAAADAAIPDIARRLAVPVGPKLHLYLADTQAHFQELQPGAAPDWADGTAWPHRGLIYLRSPRIRPGTSAPLEQVLDHEIVHVLLGQAFGPQPVPRWLQEGMAQWVAGEYDPAVVQKLAEGMLGGGLLSLDDLTTGFPADPVRATLAYAQSADLIVFIVGEYGEETLQQIIHAMAAGTPVRAAFREATGGDPDDLDAAWRGRLEGSGLWLTALTDTTAWWGLAAGLLVVGALLVRRRNRERLARWEREEALHDALLLAMRPASSEVDPIQGAPPEPPDDWRRRAPPNDWVH